MDEENNKYVRWMKNTGALLRAVYSDACEPYSIPVVPDELRKWNENAYMPKVVSIGPRYRGRRDLLPMEEIKWRCTRFLLYRTSDRNKCLEKSMEAILKLDAAVRASYVDEIKLDRYDLATIMVFDGCFLLELLISGSVEFNSKLPSRLESPHPAEELRKMELVLSDLTLLENQIPFFVLTTLLVQLFEDDKFVECCGTKSREPVIQSLVLSLYGFYSDLRVDDFFHSSHLLEIFSLYVHRERKKLEIEENKESQHATTVVNNISGEEPMHELRVEHLNRCATRLRAAGIIIKCLTDKSSSSSNNNNTPKVDTFDFNVKFTSSYVTLEISQLNITQTTESQWRNFIAWEHHKKSQNSSSSVADRCCIFTSSALLFSDLICCASDVQLLKDGGVIVDHLNKSNKDLVAFFHSIAKGVDRGIIDPIYNRKFHALNTCSATNYAMKIPILLYHYFSRFSDWIYSLHKFFRRGYNFAATMITVLTVVQTCYAIVAYHFPK